ncbi:MAG TPA: helix-turn-helix domain-containing protein [Candidatus Nanoarchaeia archaeon]|nr:helix-turn-helix domain-containing protein [Candidatus Nanoarchaeia archaeon]
MQKELKEFGLTDREIEVYLGLLKLGTASVQDISRKSNVYRTYAYEILNSLKEKGLVSYVIKSGKKYFEVAQPGKLINILKDKEVKIRSILPNLEEIYKSRQKKSKIEIYEGKEGIKTILDDFIKTNQEILVYGSTKSQIKLLEFYFPNFIKRRVKEKIKTKVITEKSKESLDIFPRNKKELRKMKFFPQKIEFPTVTNIYGGKVAILSLKDEPLGIIIENEDFLKTQRIIFDILWKISK